MTSCFSKRSVLRAHLPYSMRPNFFPLSEGLVFRCEYRCPALGLCIFLAWETTIKWGEVTSLACQ